MISRTTDEYNNQRVSTDRCPLCGVPIGQSVSLTVHIVHTCPAREAYAELGALRNGGPDCAHVQETIRKEISSNPLATPDGGEISCDYCGGSVTQEAHRIYLQSSGDHENLCQKCQTRVAYELLYRPASTQTEGL